MKKEMLLGILLSFMIVLIILINLFLINAAPLSTPIKSSATSSIPKLVFDFFNNFTAGTQGFIISLIPLIILFVISYIFIKKGNRTLIATQWLLWLIYAVYMLAKVFAFANIYFSWGILPITYSIYLINPPNAINTDAYKWFIYSILINTAVALLLSFKNDLIVTIFSKCSKFSFRKEF